MELTHLSLFSGIGGLDLAAEAAGFKTIGQCEYAEYPSKVLEKHWPEVERWKDIHELSAIEFYRRTGIREGELTCISGGFPCQPHSVAGMRKASSDERDLWPEYRRVIDEIRPKWVVAENVRGLLTSEDGRFFRGILRDFANLGYDVGWCCYRAADVGAIHPRERVGIIAHASSQRIMEQQFEKYSAKRNETQHGTYGKVKIDTNSNNVCMERSSAESIQRKSELSRIVYARSAEEWSRRCTVFEPKLCRTYDGVSNQVDRLKCLGNAVVPQQFYPIFKNISEIEVLVNNQ